LNSNFDLLMHSFFFLKKRPSTRQSSILIFTINCMIIFLSVSRNYTASPYVRFWTSGVDVFTPHDFYWDTTGVSLNKTYSNWGPGEPNNQGNEHCVDITCGMITDVTVQIILFVSGIPRAMMLLFNFCIHITKVMK
jgi:hypothetical protein